MPLRRTYQNERYCNPFKRSVLSTALLQTSVYQTYYLASVHSQRDGGVSLASPPPQLTGKEAGKTAQETRRGDGRGPPRQGKVIQH